MLAGSSAAARVRRASEQRIVIPLLSKPLIDEYREILTDPDITDRFPELTPDLVEITIRRLRFIGEYRRIPLARFEYRRDPDDAKLVEVAIDMNATQILSYDNDLLSLPRARGEAGKRFRQRLPHVTIMTAVQFVQESGAELGI